MNTFDISLLPNISQECRENYITNKDLLLIEFNRIMNENVQLHKLVQDVAGNVIYDFHRFHIALLSSALELNNYELFIHSLPIEYNTYSNQGVKYDYFLSTYQIWQQAIKNIINNDCANELNKIYQYLSAQHEKIITLSLLNNEKTFIPKHSPEIDNFVEALIAGESIQAMEICNTFMMKNTLFILFHTLIHPALVKIGTLWEIGKITSATEHLATAIITKTLSIIYSKQTYVPPTRGVAVVTASPNEYHELGAWMVATAMENDGWNVHYLGANTPTKDLLLLLKDTKADILAISVVVPFHLDGVYKLIKDIKNDALLKNIKIMIGGRAFDMMPEIALNMQADAYLHNADDAVKKARQWQCN